jgi:hypothetical protein
MVCFSFIKRTHTPDDLQGEKRQEKTKTKFFDVVVEDKT